MPKVFPDSSSEPVLGFGLYVRRSWARLPRYLFIGPSIIQLLATGRALVAKAHNKALKRTAKSYAFCSLRFAAAVRLAFRYAYPKISYEKYFYLIIPAFDFIQGVSRVRTVRHGWSIDALGSDSFNKEENSHKKLGREGCALRGFDGFS
jgi:hypothetical protein